MDGSKLTQGKDDPEFVVRDTHRRGFIVQSDITLYISWHLVKDMKAYPGGRGEVVRTHVCPSSYSLNPIVGFTFLAGLDSKGVILLLINSDQNLSISSG